MFRDTLYGSVLAHIRALSVQGAGRIGKLLDRASDSTPNSRPSVIAFPWLAPRHAGSYRQHRGTPDLDLPYHTENGSVLVFRIA
jgi:hypothetical protein